MHEAKRKMRKAKNFLFNWHPFSFVSECIYLMNDSRMLYCTVYTFVFFSCCCSFSLHQWTRVHVPYHYTYYSHIAAHWIGWRYNFRFLFVFCCFASVYFGFVCIREALSTVVLCKFDIQLGTNNFLSN